VNTPEGRRLHALVQIPLDSNDGLSVDAVKLFCTVDTAEVDVRNWFNGEESEDEYLLREQGRIKGFLVNGNGRVFGA
jgi:hypothetical protein